MALARCSTMARGGFVRVRYANYAQDLKDKVQRWLLTQGYPLEFRTGAAFRQQGWRVMHNVMLASPMEIWCAKSMLWPKKHEK
jgi:hypothetical protein